MSGFYVQREALRREAKVYEEFERNAKTVGDELRAAFDRDRNTLGNDMYGAELAKNMPEMERGIFDGLETHSNNVKQVASNLNTSARNYEVADQPPAEHR